MKIGLCDVDGHNFPNLPLMKIAAYHKARGDQVEWWLPVAKYDVVYKSKIFTFTPDIDVVPQADHIVEGGTGYSIHGNLPDEIEHITPDYSIYPQYQEAYGFLTRGCPCACPFCIVSEKEGRISRKVSDLTEFCRGQKEIKLLDPNLLASKQHVELLQQLVDSGAMVDFTQGLDIRRVTGANIDLIRKVRIKRIHFAWDNPREDLRDNFRMAKEALGLDERKMSAYVLTNYNTTIDEDLHRIYSLRDLGFTPYVMIYNKGDFVKGNGHLKPMQELRDRYTQDQIKHFITTQKLQRWQSPRIFRECPRFEDYAG